MMVLVASKERSRLTQGSPPGDLCLRVVGSARDGQVIRLTAAKCAIGSAEGCTLRLRARGVRPVHCLVLRGTHGTVARSWAPNTQINGEPFRDAVLEPGDRLTIGPVEFEVLAAEGPPVGPTDAGRTVVLDRRPADRTLPASSLADRLQGFAPRIAKRSTRWRSHVRKLVGEVRKLRSQIDQFEAAARLAPETSAAELAERAEIREKFDHHRQLNEQWETTLRELQAELGDREGQLASERTDLEDARQALAAQQHQWQTDSAARLAEFAEREQSHCQAVEALQAAQAALELERSQHEASLQAARQQLADREAELQTLTQQQGDAAGQLAEIQHRGEELNERTHSLETRERELAEGLAALQRTSNELAAAQSAFEAQQLAAQNRLDEQRTVLDAREAAHREAIAAHEQCEVEMQSAREAIAQRQAELEQGLAAAASEHERFSAERQSHEAAVQRQTEELQRREAELAERESLHASAAAELSQRAFDTVVAEPSGLESTELTARRAELEGYRAELEGQRAELEGRLAQLEDAEAAFQQAASDLAAAKSLFETEQAETLAERQRKAEELATAADELVAGKNAVAEAEAQLRSERESLFNDRLTQEAKLRQASETLERRMAEQKERESQATAEPVTTAQAIVDSGQASELAEREAKLAEQFAEFERLQESLREEREEFEHTRARTSQRLDADAEELKQERAELEAEREGLTAELEKLAADREAFETERRASLDREEAEQVSDGRRAVSSYGADEDEDDEAPEPPLQEFSRALPPSRRQTQVDTVRRGTGDTARAPQHEEEESIEQYMAALLNRSRSGQVAPAPQPVERRRNKRKSDVQTPEEEPSEAASVAAEVPVLDMPAAPVQLERRRVPEVRPDMSVLREIGITHARSAIATHGQQRSLKQAYGTLATSVLCFVAAFLVFYFSTHTVFQLTGMAILVIGIYWLGTSIWAINKVLNSMQQRRGGLRATLAEIDAEIEALRKETEAETEAAK